MASTITSLLSRLRGSGSDHTYNVSTCVQGSSCDRPRSLSLSFDSTYIWCGLRNVLAILTPSLTGKSQLALGTINQNPPMTVCIGDTYSMTSVCVVDGQITSVVAEPGGAAFVACGHRVYLATRTGFIAALTELPRAISSMVYHQQGGYLVVSCQDHIIYRVDKGSSYEAIPLAGSSSGIAGCSADSCTAEKAHFNTPMGIAVDIDGNILICDRGNHRIVRLMFDDGGTGAGHIRTICGSSKRAKHHDGSLSSCSIREPSAIVVNHSDGKLYVCNDAGYIAMIQSSSNGIRWNDGRMTTIAGSGDSGEAPIDGPGKKALFSVHMRGLVSYCHPTS
jgi:DNA-binding beta-propeller fold protein YncE